MEIECDLASIRDEDLLRKMWQQSEDFNRKKEIRSHLYKLRESRLKEFYSTDGIIMNPATDVHFGKTPLTPSHGDSLVDQSFQSLKSKEVRDSESPLRDIKFRNSGGVAGGVLVPDTTGWNVQTATEVSPDGRAYRTETVAKTDGVELLPGGRAEFAGRNEQKSSASHEGDENNYVKKAAESSKTHLKEHVVVGDENSGRTEMKSSSVTSSSSKVVSSSSTKVISSDDTGFDTGVQRLTQDPHYQQALSSVNSSTLRNEHQQQQQQQYQKSERNERKETTSNVHEDNIKYVDMDKSSPEYQQHVQHLMSQPGTIVSNTVEYPKPGVKMITTVKKLPDGTTVKTKRYETDASVDAGSLTKTLNHQEQQRVSSNTTQRTTEKQVQGTDDVFSRLSKPRESHAPTSPLKTPSTPSQEEIFSRLEKSRKEQKFSNTMDQRSTQILREVSEHPSGVPSPSAVSPRRPSDFVDNVEHIVSSTSTKKDLSQNIRNEKITSADFIETERDRFVIDHDSISHRGPDGIPRAIAPITPSRYTRPETDDVSTNGYAATEVIKQSSKSSSKFSESRRFSTETVESYSENLNENQDFTTHGFPSVRRPIDQPKGKSPSGGRPSQDFSTHGFPSVRSDKPTQEHPSSRPTTNDSYSTTEKVHIVSTDYPRQTDGHPQSAESTTTSRSKFSTNESRRQVTSTTEDFGTHGFPSVREGTPTSDYPRRSEPLSNEPSSRRPSGPEPTHPGRRPTTEDFSTHGFPSVKKSSPSGPPSSRKPSTDDFSTQGFPSVKQPGRATPTTTTAPQYDDTHNRRLPNVDRDDTISVSSDRSNNFAYEKKTDAAHQAFARSLRCASPVESIRRDSISDRPSTRGSVSSIRNNYSPIKRDVRSPSHESVSNSESSRISSATVTKTHKSTATDGRRVSGPKTKPTDKVAGRPTTVQNTYTTEPLLNKKNFAATEAFLVGERIADEPLLIKETYYQLGPSDATLPSSRLNSRQLLGTTPNTSRRPTKYNPEEEVNTLLDTATKHNIITSKTATTTPIPTPIINKSAKTQDTSKPSKPDTLYSGKPKTPRPDGYVSQHRATEITEKHNQTTNKQVSYPHYIPSAPKADRSSPHPERPKTISSPDRPTKFSPSITSTSPHNAPKTVNDKPQKVAPSTSPTTKPSPSPSSKVDNTTTRFTKTVKVDKSTARRDDNRPTKTKPEPETQSEPEDTDEGYVPADVTGGKKPRSKRPTSDDEGFEPDSPRAASPTSDFEYRRPTTVDEEDSIFKRTHKTDDKRTVTTEFLDTERSDKKPSQKPEYPRTPEDTLSKKPGEPDQPSETRPRGSRPPLDRSETYEERCRQILGIEKETTVDRARRIQDFIDTERTVVSVDEGKPHKSSPQKRQPDDVVSIEDCDDDDSPKYPLNQKSPKRVYTETPDHPTSKLPSKDSPRGESPYGRPKAPRPTDEKLFQSTVTTTTDRTTIDDRYPIDRPRETSPGKPGSKDSPREKSPTGKPRGPRPTDETAFESTVTSRTDYTTVDDHYPTDRPRESYPGKKRPNDLPREQSPSGMPKGPKPTDDRVIQSTVTTTTDRTTVDDRYPTDHPSGISPSEKPRKREPTDEDIESTYVTDTTKTTHGKITDRPRGTSPTNSGLQDSPREKSPTGKPRGPRPTEETVIQSNVTTRTDRTTIDQRRPTDRPRGTSPSEKPRKREPTDEDLEETYVTKTTRTTREKITDRPRGTSPTKPGSQDSPRERSPTGKPRSPRPTDETVIQSTVKTRTDRTTTDNSYPTDRPRGTPPSEKPRKREPTDEDLEETCVTKTTRTTREKITDRPRGTSPTKHGLQDSPRERSPTGKPRGPRPTDETIIQSTVKTRTDRTTTDDSYLTDRPRGTSPSEKPRKREPTDEDLEETYVTKTTKTTREKITDRPRGTSPTKPGPQDLPRERSPTGKPRGPRPTDETVIQSTVKTRTDRTTTDDSYLTDRPRGTSPFEKPRKREPTDEDLEETYGTKTTKTTREKITDRPRGTSPTKPGPQDLPRERSPTGKPRGPRPTDETIIQSTLKTRTDRTTTDDTYPTDRPRGTSPSEKPRRHEPTDEDLEETYVTKTTKTTRDKITDRPRAISPTKPGPQDSPRERSPTGKPRGPRPTDGTVLQSSVTTRTDRTTIDQRHPTDRPRGTSPSEKPRKREPTDEDLEETYVTKTTRTTREKITDRPRGTSPMKPGPQDSPRERSPTGKPGGPRPTDETVIQSTVKTRTDRTTTDDSYLTDRPRGTSPSEKPRKREPADEDLEETYVTKTTKTTGEKITDRPRGTSPTKPLPQDSPRERSPTGKPRGPRPTDETVIQSTVKTRTDRTTTDDSYLTDRPRGTSPSEKPRKREQTDEDLEETYVTKATKTTREKITDRPRGTSPTKPGPQDSPRERSPTGKPRGPRPTDETILQSSVTTRTDRTTIDQRHPTDRPRGTSPSEKQRKREPTDEDLEEKYVTKTTKTTREQVTDRPRGISPTKTGPQASPREKSPTGKPRGPRPIDETVIQSSVTTRTDRTTIDECHPTNRPRGTSPSEKPRKREPTDEDLEETYVTKTTKTTREKITDRPRGISPTKPGPQDSPRERSPTGKPRGPRPTDETVVQSTVTTRTDRTTFDERHPTDRPRGTSPSEKPRKREPTDEDLEETYVTNSRKTTRENITDRPRGISPTKPGPQDSPRERSPTGKPRGPRPTDETVVQSTVTTRTDRTTIDERHPTDRPRGTSPSEKPRKREPTDDDIEKTYLSRTTKTTHERLTDRPRKHQPEDDNYPDIPSDEESDDTITRENIEITSCKQSRPSVVPAPDKPNRPRSYDTSKTTTKNTVQLTDFEKRYPKGFRRDSSPVEKVSPRRPSKPTTSSLTTTIRKQSTIEEQVSPKSQRPKLQPSVRDKAPTKVTSSTPRSQPMAERRVPAELTSIRKPKPTAGSTTKTSTQTTVTRVSATLPRTAKDTPKKPTKPTRDVRPTARSTETKRSPSISPDSSPSRPTSEVDFYSPQRSPNASPSRKSPSPTRSVKLEDITSSVVTTGQTTISIDKSTPKVTHITTAKFQVTPPASPKTASRKPITKLPTKPSPTRDTTNKVTTKKTTTTRKEVNYPTDSERDSEVPTDLEDVDTALSPRPSMRKIPVTARKESAPVNRVTQVDKNLQKMSRSTSENLFKTSVVTRPRKQEPLEQINQREPTKPTGAKMSPKTERRPSKHLTTKTINLTTFDKVLNSEDMENVVIDIQQAKSSREPSPNKIVPTPVGVDAYTGKPRYPDVVQEPEDEPRKRPIVKNIPIFEEETNDFVGCQITEVNDDSHESTTKVVTRKVIDKESRPQRPTPTIVTSDNVDNECLLSVHDKVSKFISTAEEVSRPKPSAPFRREAPEADMSDDDECLLTVDEKVNKFLKTAESVTKEVITSTPKTIDRPRIDELDDDLKTDECVLSVSEKVNKFITKAEKLAPSVPQRSPELVARIERQISRQTDTESDVPEDTQEHPESPDSEDNHPSPTPKVRQTKSLSEREEKKYTDRQIDILSRPSIWEKKPKSDVKLDDILSFRPEERPEPVNGPSSRRTPVRDQPDAVYSKPINALTDSVSKKKEIFESKISTQKITSTPKPTSKSPASKPSSRSPDKSPRRSEEPDSKYPAEFTPRNVREYSPEPDDIHEDVYGSSKTHRLHETSSLETSIKRRSPERSPTRKPTQQTSQTPTRRPKQPENHSPTRRYPDDHSPRHVSPREAPQTDSYSERRESFEYTSSRRSSTQKYTDEHSPVRRTPHDKSSPSPIRKPKQPVDEHEADYDFSSIRDETNQHHTTRTAYRRPKDTPLNPTSIPGDYYDDEDRDHSPARSTSTISSQKRTSLTSHRATSSRYVEDFKHSRRPSSPSSPSTTGRSPRTKAVPETVTARRNIFERTPGDSSPRPTTGRPSYMDHTKSSLEHIRRDSLEITKTNYSRKSSMEEEPYESSPRTTIKFGVDLKHHEEPKFRKKLSSSDISNIEDVFDIELLEEMLNVATSYEQRRRIRAQIRVVKKLLETKTKEEVSRMTKITTIRKSSTASVRESPTPRRETPTRTYRKPSTDDIDSESIIESHHVEEHEETIRKRSISPQTKTSKTVTKVTEIRKTGDSVTPKRTLPKKDEPKESKPIWATKNILKKPSENEKVARVLSAKKTTSTTSSSTSRTQQSHRQRAPADEDCITSSYGIGPTDEDGKPLFGIRALKKKTTATGKPSQPSETTKVTGTVITEKYYSENGAEPVGERKVTVYSTNPEEVDALETQYDRRDSETVRREKLSKDGVTTVTKVQKIGKYKPGDLPIPGSDIEFGKTTPVATKSVRRGSVKEMSEKFIRKESNSSVAEKSSGYPKAGLILRTRTNSGATADTADQYEHRSRSMEYDDESDDECNVEIRTSRKHSKMVTESEDETEIRRKVNTRSFLNSAGSKVTGVDDVLDRMRNADNVVVDGDTLEDREARALLNKFLGASVLMSGMESIIPEKELKKATTGADSLKTKGQEVKTTRITKTIKAAAGGSENSSSPVARETCDFEEIWDEEILKELLEKSTSYEERRSIRARLRKLMAEREAQVDVEASSKASDKDKKIIEQQPDNESSDSEYEEVVEEYTDTDDEDPTTTTTTTSTTKTAINTTDKKKDKVKDDANVKKVTEQVQKTTITKSQDETPATKSKETKTVVVEKTTIVTASTTVDDDDTSNKSDEKKEVNESDSSNKGESLLIPLLQGLLHKNMPQARSSSSTSKIATAKPTTTAIANQNSNHLKSSLKSNNSSTSSNSTNSSGNSGLSSEVSKNSSSLGQAGSSLKVSPQQIEDSGTESGEDLRLIAAGIRDSMQIAGIEDQSDMSLIKEVTNALNRLESSLKEGKDLALDTSKRNTLLALVERLQTGLTAPDKLSSAAGEDQNFPDETSSPEADAQRSNRQRFAKRRNRNNRHTVGVSKEELADARRYMEEMVMMENLSNCTTPESNAPTTPPQFVATPKTANNPDTPPEPAANLYRPNQFVPNNLKHSTEAGSVNSDVQFRQKKVNSGSAQRQNAGKTDRLTVESSDTGKRPLSDPYDSPAPQPNRVSFVETKQDPTDAYTQERNQYNRSYHIEYNQPDVTNTTNRASPDSSRYSRFNTKKQMMKRANTIDIPKTHRYNPEFDTDSEYEDKSAMNVKGLRSTVQVSVKRRPRQVVPAFEPKTENDHKFLAFIKKQNAIPGLSWNSSKSVSNWTNKFDNIKNIFESGTSASQSHGSKVSTVGSSAKDFWKKTEEPHPPKVSTNVLTSALKAKKRSEQHHPPEMFVPKPVHMNNFVHNPQSAFRPVDSIPDTAHMQFKPIPMERPTNMASNYSHTKANNSPSYRKPVSDSPVYSASSPTKTWVKKKTATNSPVTLPWTVKAPENNTLKAAASKFEQKPSEAALHPVQRHQSFKQQEAQKRPSLPNASQPYQYDYDEYSQPSYMSTSQPASYAEYVPSIIVRKDSLTNPHAEPLVLTSNKPAYSPRSLQHLDYYNENLNPYYSQTDMTDDDIDDMESMTEYRVESKVMGKPVSQQAVTIGSRTAHMSDDEVFGKNSRAAKSLLSVMKNIANGNGEKPPTKVERKSAPNVCMSPDGREYKAPIVDPIFPEITKFEPNRLPEYIGPLPHKSQEQPPQPVVEYQKNPAYIPPVDYQQQAQDRPKAYLPPQQPNVYHQPRREAPKSLPLSPSNYVVQTSPNLTPDLSPLNAQAFSDGRYMHNVSEVSTPSDYPSYREAYQPASAPRSHPVSNQFNSTPKSYAGPQPVVNLPQIPLETSFTKVYDKPRPPVRQQKQTSPKVQPSYQPPAFVPQEQYNQSPGVQPTPSSPSYPPLSVHQPRTEYYQSPKIQQNPQSPEVLPPRPTYQPRNNVSVPYHQQSPKVQQNSQPPSYSPQAEVPPQYQQPPRVPPQQQAYQSQAPVQAAHGPQASIAVSAPVQSFVPKTNTDQSPKPVKPQITQKSESVIQSSRSQKQQIQTAVVTKKATTSSASNAIICKQASIDGRKRVQSQSQVYEKIDEVRRKSLGNVLEITRLEREAEEKAAAIKQDMYTVQQDAYTQQQIKQHQQRKEIRQEETKVYKSSAPDDTPDIVKSSLKKDDIPILKKFGPPQRHCYIPNAYQNPLTKSETTTTAHKLSQPAPRKFSAPTIKKGPVIVETPSTPQPDAQDEIPRNIVFNKVTAFTSMSRRFGESSSTDFASSQQNTPNKLSKCDSWHQICQLQSAAKPPSPKFNSGTSLRRSKSGHTLALPKLYEAGYDKTEITQKQKTVAAYFSGQKSPKSLSRNSSQTNLAEVSNSSAAMKKSSINRIRTSEKASIGKQTPSSGLSRSHTMPQIANINLLDETNVEDAFEQLMNELSTTTTEKTETKNEDGAVVTTTTKVTTRTVTGAPKPVSPFAKFQQLDKQNSLQSPKSPLTPSTPGGSTPIFRFTDPALNARAATFKEQLLQWCQSKTQEYENVQITNFSTSWTDGLAFCALIHHFLPDAFDYSKLTPKERRHNFELAFRVADEKAGIAPLLDVEDMVVMKRPDWKCVFTYVQSIYRRFRNCQ